LRFSLVCLVIYMFPHWRYWVGQGLNFSLLFSMK